jgi:hypothetical protein
MNRNNLIKNEYFLVGFIFIFAFLLASISFISAGDKVFVVAAAGDECEDVPGCANASVSFIFWDDDCDLSDFNTSTDQWIENDCPAAGSSPPPMPGFNQPTSADGGKQLDYSFDGDGYNVNTSSLSIGDTFIIGTAWDNDGWNPDRGSGKNCSWSNRGRNYFPVGQTSPYHISTPTQNDWINQHNCWLYLVCDSDDGAKVREKYQVHYPVMQEDGSWVPESKSCVNTGELACAECATNSDCTTGSGSQTQTGICCGGSCMNDSVNNVCCTTADDPSYNCGQIFDRNNGQPDAIIEEGGDCTTAGPSTLPGEADTKAIPADAPLPVGWLDVMATFPTRDSNNRLIERRSSFIRDGFAKQVADNNNNIFAFKLDGTANPLTGDFAPISESWLSTAGLTLTSSTEDSRHQYFNINWETPGLPDGWSTDFGARLDTFTVFGSTRGVTGYDTLVRRANSGSRTTGRSRGGSRSGGENVYYQIPRFGQIFSEYDEEVASATAGFSFRGKVFRGMPLEASAGAIANPFGLGGYGSVRANWMNPLNWEAIENLYWGADAIYVFPPPNSEPYSRVGITFVDWRF